MKPTQAIKRTREVLRRQHKALSTEDCYLFWLRRYMAAIRKIPAETLERENWKPPWVIRTLKH